MQQLHTFLQRPAACAPAVVPAYGRRRASTIIKPCRFRPEVSPEFMSAFKEATARQRCSSEVAERLGVPQLCFQQEFNAAGNSGHVVWPAGIELATYVRNNLGPKLAGKKVLELGAGTGVVGLTAAALGASVTLTDLPDQLTQLQGIALASLEAVRPQGGRLQVLECSLHAPNPAIAATTYDVVVAADLINQELLVEPLLALVADLLNANPAALVLLAHHHREESIDARLAASLKPHGLRLEALQRPPRDDAEDIEIVRLALRFR